MIAHNAHPLNPPKGIRRNESRVPVLKESYDIRLGGSGQDSAFLTTSSSSHDLHEKRDETTVSEVPIIRVLGQCIMNSVRTMTRFFLWMGLFLTLLAGGASLALKTWWPMEALLCVLVGVTLLSLSEAALFAPLVSLIMRTGKQKPSDATRLSRETKDRADDATGEKTRDPRV